MLAARGGVEGFSASGMGLDFSGARLRQLHFYGEPCIHGHDGLRYIKHGHCVQCGNERARKSYDGNRDQYNARNKLWREANKAHTQSKRASWDKRNKEKRADCQFERACRVFLATPAWVDKQKVIEVYRAARRLSRETGEKHTVDHVIPLNGRDVCGLHVHYNLQVMTAKMNSAKKNRPPKERMPWV